jgi:hypothetical protein
LQEVTGARVWLFHTYSYRLTSLNQAPRKGAPKNDTICQILLQLMRQGILGVAWGPKKNITITSKVMLRAPRDSNPQPQSYSFTAVGGPRATIAPSTLCFRVFQIQVWLEFWLHIDSIFKKSLISTHTTQIKKRPPAPLKRAAFT